MERPRIFASIMFVRSDYSSGVYKQSIEYDSTISIEEYSDFFLNQIRMRYDVIKATVFSIGLAQHDKNGNYLFDEHGHIGISFKETSNSDYEPPVSVFYTSRIAMHRDIETVF